MAFTFCPNLSLPENKQRIKEIGINKFYQEYYKQHFDISPNTPMLDELFVDIDKFSDTQQKEVVDSIVFLLEEGKKEGYTDVEDLFDYAKDVFLNQRDELEQYNEDGAWDKNIQVFNDIEANWDRFRTKVDKKLKNLGVKVTKVLNDAETADIDLDRSGLEFTSTEASYQRDNYDDEFTFSKSSKDTASAHLKLKLSLIPEVEFNGKDLEPVQNYLGLNKFMPLDKVWTALQAELTGLATDRILPTLEELGKTNPMFAEVYRQIMEDPNTNIQNEFVVTFSKQQAKFVTVKQGRSDNGGNRTLKVFATNRQGAADIIIEDWYNTFKTSPIIKEIDGNYFVDQDKSKQLQSWYNKFKESFTNTSENVDKLQLGLSRIGIDISTPALTSILKGEVKLDDKKVTGLEFIKSYLPNLFNSLTRSNIEDLEDDENTLSANNPFLSETTVLNVLARAELKYQPSLYENSFVSGDGKSKYANVNNSYLSKLLIDLKNDRYVDRLLGTSYAGTSLWLNKILNDGDFKSNFNIEYLDTLGSDDNKITNKKFSQQNTREKEFTRVSLFQNQGRKYAKYLGLIPSDKTTIPVITADRVKVVIDGNGNITNRTALDAIYTAFTAEYNRIKDVQSQAQDIVGYHYNVNKKGHRVPGMGHKFLVYDFLNNNPELFEEDGTLRNIDDATLRTVVTPLLLDFYKKGIKAQYKYWKSLNLLNTFDKSYKSKVLGGYENDLQYNAALAADYFTNQFLANFNYTQVIGGDPALFGKANIDATWINYTKRTAKDIAPGLDGNFVTPTYKVLFLKDLKVDSKHLNEYRKVIGDKADTYQGLNPADAQEYTTLAEHAEVMRAYGKVSPEIEAAIQRLIDGGTDSNDIKLILQPMKPVQVGTVIDDELKINKVYYIKTSSFPLVPAFTKGLEIDKLRIAMENNSIGRAVYESGVKLGLSGDIQSIKNEDGTFNNNLIDNAVTLNRTSFRIQQEIPFHGEDKLINEGSQGRKLILLDVDDTDQLIIAGQYMSGREAKDLYEALHIEKMSRAFNELKSDLGIVEEGGKYKITDLSKLQQILVDEAESRNYNINDIYGLQIETVDGIQRFKVPLVFNNSSSRLESILNSIVTNRVIKADLPGFTKVQGSNAGFSKVATQESLTEDVKNDIVWLNPNDTELNYIRLSEDGNELLQADILVPSWFNDIDVKQYVNADGSLDLNRIPEDLLTIIGIRIPTQGYNSIMSFKVKGFLPKYMGDLAIVPAEIVAQMGSDFDVDKLFIYRYEYTNTNGKLSKVQPVTSKLNSASEAELNNTIIQFYEDRYKDPQLLSKILEPNGYGRLPELSQSIAKILGTNSNKHFFTAEAQNTIHTNNNDGKIGVGVFSLFSTFIRTAQDFSLSLENPIAFYVDNKFYKVQDLFTSGIKETPATIISYFQSAAVDNAKEQILGNLNINTHTMHVAGTIALAGFDEGIIANFLSQPILREYTALNANANDITDSEYDPFREGTITINLLNKFGLEVLPGDSISDRLETVKTKYFSEDSLRQELANPTQENQLAIFKQFLTIRSAANSIRNLQSATNTDTNGLGIRYSDMQVKVDQVNKIRESMAYPVKGASNVFDRYKTGYDFNILRDSLEIFSNLLPYDSPYYRSTLKAIQTWSGRALESPTTTELDTMYKNVRSALFTNSLSNIDVEVERERLLFGKTAIGNRILTYKKSPAGKKNILAQMLNVRKGENKFEPIRIETINSPATTNSDITDAMASFYRMYYKGTEEEQAIARDLVKYFIVTGANQSPTSISKFIPYDILEEYNLSNNLHNIVNDVNDIQSDVLDNFTQQYFQHNPKAAIKFETNKVISYTTEGFKLPYNTDYVVPEPVGDGVSLVAPLYMSVYDRKSNKFLLYKQGIYDGSTESYEYTQIPTLGNAYLSEYNLKNQTQYSMFKSNQTNTTIPSEVSQVIRETTDTLEVMPVVSSLDADVQYFEESFRLNQSEVEPVLANIIETSQNPEFVNIAKDLRRVIVDGITIKAGNLANTAGLFEDNTVTINVRNIITSSQGNTLANIERVILHELLHAVTAYKIASYDNLSATDKVAVDAINELFEAYKSSVNQEELAKFNSLVDKLSNKEQLTSEEVSFINTHKSEYYPLNNIYEFIAAGLTDQSFADTLKDNNFWSRLWDKIADLLGLSKNYRNDYEALYDGTFTLATNTATKSSDIALNDLSPLEQKQEFLNKYHKADGQEISLPAFNKINESVKANTKYSSIILDAPFENGKRVLRVFTKKGIPLYDIAPEPKSKEELFVEKTIKKFNTLISKYERNVNYSSNTDLQTKVAELKTRVQKFKDDNSAFIVLDDAKNKLTQIARILGKKAPVSSTTLMEIQDHLLFYRDVRKYISFTSDFNKENRLLDTIVNKSEDLLQALEVKKKQTLINNINSKFKLSVDLEKLLSDPTIDVGSLESTLQSAAFSSSQLIQLMQKYVNDAQVRTNEDYSQYLKEHNKLITDFLSKHKSYDILLQKDAKGDYTGRLLNKYSQGYYDRLIDLKGSAKKQGEFFRANTKVEWTTDGKELWKEEADQVKLQYPEWATIGTTDYAIYNQWRAKRDPNIALQQIKRGKYVNLTQYRQYIKAVPIDKWIDPRYTDLVNTGGVATELYDLLDKEFRNLNVRYGRKINDIPEVSKDLLSYFLKGDIKGGFSKLNTSIIESITTKLEPNAKAKDLDINGLPHDTIPVYYMSNNLDIKDKSLDLANVLLMAKGQDFALKHKADVEPYLIMLKETIQDLSELKTNLAGDVVLDEDNKPVQDTGNGKNKNLTQQARWILENFLYEKGTKQSGQIKNLKIGDDRVVTWSKLTDTLGDITRVKGMGLNVFSGIGNVLFGIISNSVYSGDRKTFNEKNSAQALGIMLQASVPGSNMKEKVSKLMHNFNVLKETNQIKYGRTGVKSIENPLSELSVYEFQKRGEYFVQGQTAMAILLNNKVTDLQGTKYSLFDAFDSKGEWKADKFGPNPYLDLDTKVELMSKIDLAIANIHGDYANGIQAKKDWIGRALLIFRTWIPQSFAARFGKEYTTIDGDSVKGRYRSYQFNHLAILPLIKDAYKAFGTSSEEDTIDKRNLRMNIIELGFIAMLSTVALILKSLITPDDDEEKAALTFAINSLTRASGDLTFFMNPYSFKSTIREPIPAFKTLMDTFDLIPASVDLLEGNDIYKSGINKDKSKIAHKLRKAIPIINQPDKLVGVASTILDGKN